MKAIWKILLGAAAVAAVTPYKVQKDEETGAVKITSVTWSATYSKDENGANVAVKLLPALTKNDECECDCCDEECCCEGEECCCCGEETEEEGITVEVEPEEPCCCGCQESPEPENA